MYDWDNLKFFLAVAKAGNITAAGAKLGVNHSTVSRRISAFEKQLGTRLFDRLPSGYALTSSGEEVRAMAQPVEEVFAAVRRNTAGRDVSLDGVLRVTAPEAMTAGCLMPHFAVFSKTHPGIELQVIVTSEFVSLSNRDADVAIRSTRRPPDNLVGRRIGSDCSAVYASRAYLDERGCTPETIADSDKHCWVWWDRSDTRPRWIMEHYPSARLALRVDARLTMLEAVRAGVGMGQLPCGLGAQDPELLPIPPFEPQIDREIWILTHPDLRRVARVRAFMDFMAKAIARDKDVFEGKITRSHKVSVTATV